jgi:hypothetical protein
MMEWFGRTLQNHLRRSSVVWSYMRMYVSREMHILEKGEREGGKWKSGVGTIHIVRRDSWCLLSGLSRERPWRRNLRSCHFRLLPGVWIALGAL